MPIYEWYCSTCELEFETLCHMGEIRQVCPTCNIEDNVVRQLSTFDWQLNGDGWYRVKPKPEGGSNEE